MTAGKPPFCIAAGEDMGAGERALRHGNVHNSLFRHGKRHSQHMEKPKCGFPTSCKQRFPQLHEQGSYTHSHNAELLLKLPLSPIHLFIKTEVHIIKNVNTGYMVRAPTRGAHHPFTTEYRHAAAPTQRGDSRQDWRLFSYPKTIFQAAGNGRKRGLYGIF